MFDMKNTNILQGKNEIIIFLLNGKVGRLNIYAKSSIKYLNIIITYSRSTNFALPGSLFAIVLIFKTVHFHTQDINNNKYCCALAAEFWVCNMGVCVGALLALLCSFSLVRAVIRLRFSPFSGPT